eukprot:89269_1
MMNIIKNKLTLVFTRTILYPEQTVLHRLVEELRIDDLYLISLLQFMQNNQKYLFSMIWIDLLSKNIDELSIVKLREICRDSGEGQFSGEVLVQYETSNILNTISNDIKHVSWQQYIEQYMEKWTTILGSYHSNGSDTIQTNIDDILSHFCNQQNISSEQTITDE